jgi:hypothetical protein
VKIEVAGLQLHRNTLGKNENMVCAFTNGSSWIGGGVRSLTNSGMPGSSWFSRWRAGAAWVSVCRHRAIPESHLFRDDPGASGLQVCNSRGTH